MDTLFQLVSLLAIVSVVCCTRNVTRIGCYQVDLNGCSIWQAIGTYYIWEEGDKCDGLVIYKHEQSTRMMYYIDGHWVVHDEPCSFLALDVADLKVEDKAIFAEDISGIWMENNNGAWINNYNADTLCRTHVPGDDNGAGTASPKTGDDDGTMVIIIVSCVCAVVICVVVVIVVLYYVKWRKPRTQTTKPPLELTDELRAAGFTANHAQRRSSYFSDSGLSESTNQNQLSISLQSRDTNSSNQKVSTISGQMPVFPVHNGKSHSANDYSYSDDYKNHTYEMPLY